MKLRDTDEDVNRLLTSKYSHMSEYAKTIQVINGNTFQARLRWLRRDAKQRGGKVKQKDLNDLVNDFQNVDYERNKKAAGALQDAAPASVST